MFSPGTLLAGKYELVEIAGQGGMATVWRARARGVGGFTRQLAIKVMLERLCHDPHFVQLFVEEARVSSQLQHPNVVQIFDFGEHDGIYFLAMEWVDGVDLLDYARSFTDQGYFMPWAALATICVEVLKGMQAAHSRIDERGMAAPIFHRDVTPHNILLGTNGVVKLTDFGLAKATDRGTMTLPHVLKGKISYTAPEMTRGVRANERTDIFSLGVTLWEALTGRKMFDAGSPLQIVRQIQAWNVPPLEELRPDLPAELLQIVQRSVARNPDERFASAQEMALALARLLPALPDLARLGRSVAEAKQRIQSAQAPDDLAPLKEALRPTATTPTFRAATPEARAARVARAPEPAPAPARPPPMPVRASRVPEVPTPPSPTSRISVPPVVPAPAPRRTQPPPPIVSPAPRTTLVGPAPRPLGGATPPLAPTPPGPPAMPATRPRIEGLPASVKPPSEVRISHRGQDSISVVIEDEPSGELLDDNDLEVPPSSPRGPGPQPPASRQAVVPPPPVEPPASSLDKPRSGRTSEPSLLDISIELDLNSGTASGFTPPVARPPGPPKTDKKP